ncbi:MAG: prenyltransferase [Betaproteobacteria bacterium RIFCSPLOWO2_12_FULL_65_14]|nr:MAG: prenyltransferase [Betaproteobacteria bacterium RIFCSPLOWO2_12_FULL_65_14]
MNAMRGRVVGTVALAMLLGLGGCAGMSRQDQNTAIGAGVGGVAGNVLGGGGVLGTAAGAVVGGVIGHEVGKK